MSAPQAFLEALAAPLAQSARAVGAVAAAAADAVGSVGTGWLVVAALIAVGLFNAVYAGKVRARTATQIHAPLAQSNTLYVHRYARAQVGRAHARV